MQNGQVAIVTDIHISSLKQILYLFKCTNSYTDVNANVNAKNLCLCNILYIEHYFLFLLLLQNWMILHEPLSQQTE